jgi:hypothetical protein
MDRWSYSGKDGLEIHWTAQHMSFVDKYVREVTNFIWHCWKLGPATRDGNGVVHLWKLPLVVFRRDKWTPALMTDAATAGESQGGETKVARHRPMAGETATWFSMRSVAQHYNTHERVAQIEVKRRSPVRKAVPAT